jgi:hypothetical protein
LQKGNTMTNIIGTIINDCADGNAKVRQELRFESLFGSKPSFFGVGRQAPDIEAAGNLLDQLEALRNLPASRQGKAQAVVLVNVAPRGDSVKQKWDNGTPFCYAWVDKTLIVSTYAGQALSLAKAHGLIDKVELLDVPTVTKAATVWGELTDTQAKRINHSQFRSLEFLPLVAYWLANERLLPSKTVEVTSLQSEKGLVWCIDNFGNAKTTLLPEDIDFSEGKAVTLADGKTATCYRRLADVPKNETAAVVGSSGYDDKRFLEVVVQWQDKGLHASDSATSRHNLSVGATVLQ